MKKSISTALFALFVVGIHSVHAATFDLNLAYGASGQSVTDLQRFLSVQGLYSGPVTGDFFSLTKAAVIKFQEAHNINPASGYFGPLTRATVNALVTRQATSASTSTSSVASAVQSAPSISAPTLPAPTASELQEVSYMCSIPQMTSLCSSTFWNGYNTNAAFRTNVDSIAAQLEQKLAQESDAKATCLENAAQPYNPSVSPAANLYTQDLTLWACGIGPAPDQASYQEAQTQTTQPQYVPVQSYTQPSKPTTQTCTTEPYWDAGVLRFTTTCASS